MLIPEDIEKINDIVKETLIRYHAWTTGQSPNDFKDDPGFKNIFIQQDDFPSSQRGEQQPAL